MGPSDVEITSPCPIDFGATADRDARRSYCAHCDKHVHNLSALRKREAQSLIDAHDASETDAEMCITYTPDGAGGIQFRPSRRQMLYAAAATAVAGVTTPMTAQASGALNPNAKSMRQTLLDWWYGAEDEAEPDETDEPVVEKSPPEPTPVPVPAGGLRSTPRPAGGIRRPAPPPQKKP